MNHKATSALSLGLTSRCRMHPTSDNGRWTLWLLAAEGHVGCWDAKCTLDGHSESGAAKDRNEENMIRDADEATHTACSRAGKTHTAPLFDNAVQRDAWRTHPPWLADWHLNIIRVAGGDAHRCRRRCAPSADLSLSPRRDREKQNERAMIQR